MRGHCNDHSWHNSRCQKCNGANFAQGAAEQRTRVPRGAQYRASLEAERERKAERRRGREAELRRLQAEDRAAPKPTPRDRIQAGIIGAVAAFLFLLSTLPSPSVAQDLGILPLVVLGGTAAFRFLRGGLGNLIRVNAVDGAVFGMLLGAALLASGEAGSPSGMAIAGRVLIAVFFAAVSGGLAYLLRRRASTSSSD